MNKFLIPVAGASLWRGLALDSKKIPSPPASTQASHGTGWQYNSRHCFLRDRPPETFLIDKTGILRCKHSGPINPEIWQ